MRIKSLLKFKGVEFINYDKGREVKKQLTQKENKELRELTHTVDSTWNVLRVCDSTPKLM